MVAKSGSATAMEASSASALSLDGSKTTSLGDLPREVSFKNAAQQQVSWSAMVSSAWSTSLAFVALLDFAASMVQHHHVDAEVEEFFEETSSVHDTLASFATILRENTTEISLFFSLCWFIDAFVSANENWIHAHHKMDERRLLDGDTSNPTFLGLSKPTWAYFGTLAFQILLLPVGFYQYFGGRIVTSLGVELPHFLAGYESMIDSEAILSYNANFSLLFAIINYVVDTVSRLLQRKGKQLSKDAAVKLAKHAMRHPVSFSHSMKKFLTILRWAKYLIPLIATSNKFLQNFLDLMKRYRQEREAEIAKKIRQRLVRDKSPSAVREYSALLIQKTYRARRERKAAKALRLLLGDKETLAAMKLQSRFRAKLAAARSRIAEKRAELDALKRKQQELKRDAQEMSDEDRARMYYLQRELRNQTKYVLTKMLLRPNTTFAVVWKTIFVVSVLFEISTLVIKPYTHGRDIETFLMEDFLPKRWSTLDECMPLKLKWYQKVAHIFDKQKMVTPRPKPWYCANNAAQFQGAAVSAAEFVIDDFEYFLAFVFFCDVFISFFTGRIDEETGVLKPQAFFPRWILPGVILQMAVNPQMETIAGVLKRSIAEIVLLGPLRVTRWIIAAIVPLALVSRELIHTIALQLHESG